MNDRTQGNGFQQVHAHFWMYPVEGGYKYAGFAHSIEETANDFARWALSRDSNALIDIAYTIAIHTGNDIVDEYLRVFTLMMEERTIRETMCNDGTVAALMRHTPISDYPTR